jgi:hypothetical protein
MFKSINITAERLSFQYSEVIGDLIQGSDFRRFKLEMQKFEIFWNLYVFGVNPNYRKWIEFKEFSGLYTMGDYKDRFIINELIEKMPLIFKGTE